MLDPGAEYADNVRIFHGIPGIKRRHKSRLNDASG